MLYFLESEPYFLLKVIFSIIACVALCFPDVWYRILFRKKKYLFKDQKIIQEYLDNLDDENSQGIKSNFYQPEHPVRSIGEPKDDDIKLSFSVEKFNLDLWHDPKLRYSLFFSNRLAQYLFKAGFNKKQLGLIRCIVK